MGQLFSFIHSIICMLTSSAEILKHLTSIETSLAFNHSISFIFPVSGCYIKKNSSKVIPLSFAQIWWFPYCHQAPYFSCQFYYSTSIQFLSTIWGYRQSKSTRPNHSPFLSTISLFSNCQFQRLCSHCICQMAIIFDIKTFGATIFM